MSPLSKLAGISLALSLSILPAVGADEKSPDDALRAVVESENNFARAGAERGIRDSFLQFFADQSIIFAPEPKDGKKFYTEYKDKGRKLIWQPIFATVAKSGDIGLTTGPWEMRTSMTDNKSLGYGEFTTIWKKQRDNSWKVALDVGIQHDQPRDPPGEIQLLPPGDATTNVDLARSALEKAEKTFAEMLKEGAGSAITAAASNDIRVLRENSFPGVGKVAAKLMLSSDNAKVTREKAGGGMSAAGDLAYRYGTYSAERANVSERGYFFSVWKAEADQDWKILLDLQKKEPPPEKK